MRFFCNKNNLSGGDEDSVVVYLIELYHEDYKN
jgi:hypothetical protein